MITDVLKNFRGIHGPKWSDPLAINDDTFLFMVRGYNDIWIHIYLGKVSSASDRGYESNQIMILNHPDIGIYHDDDKGFAELGMKIEITGVDLI